MADLKTSDRVLLTGPTGSGKSYLARAIFEAAPPPRLVVDPKAEAETAYAVVFRDPRRLPDSEVARFIPTDPGDLDAYDALYRTIFDAGPRLIWCDEARSVAPTQRVPLAVVTVLTQGRSKGIGHYACTQRPVWAAVEVRSEAQHVIAFPTANPDDLRRLAASMSVDSDQLRQWFARLPRYGFVWYSTRQNRITLCPPLSW